MTTEHEIIRDNNKLIVEFLNWEKVGTYTYKSKSITEEEPDFDNRDIKTIDTFSILWGEMKFNSDWNWLIEVVEKIKSIVSLMEIPYTNELIAGLITVNKEAVYNACVEFIKWYNEENK